jgi:hypothetical protein
MTVQGPYKTADQRLRELGDGIGLPDRDERYCLDDLDGEDPEALAAESLTCATSFDGRE